MRLGLIRMIGAALIAFPTSAIAQQTPSIARVGVLWTSSPAGTEDHLKALRQGLNEQGYLEGSNLALEQRWGADIVGRLPLLAAELVDLKVDVIVTQGTPAALATKQATNAIPIVMMSSGDPVASGLIASLARPGGNVTGFALLAPQLNAKRLELLREIVPATLRIAILADAVNVGPGGLPIGLPETRAAARSMNLQVSVTELRNPEEMEKAFEAASSEPTEAIVVLASPVLNFHSKRLVELAAKHRLPAVYQSRMFARDGGLVSFGEVQGELPRRTAAYVDRILKGAKPADLPVEQPTKFELVVNLKTAKTLGITIPQSILLRADEVIE